MEQGLSVGQNFDYDGIPYELVPFDKLIPPLPPEDIENQEYALDIAKSMLAAGWSGRPLWGMDTSVDYWDDGESDEIALRTGSHRYVALQQLKKRRRWPSNLPPGMVPVYVMRRADVSKKLWDAWRYAGFPQLKRLAELGKGPDPVVQLMRAERNPAGPTKQPWQMTQMEHLLWVANAEDRGFNEQVGWQREIHERHFAAVKRAIEEGKPVPAKVLKEFPELRQNPAGPTYAQALVMARHAGQKIGDTSGFQPWLVKSKLDSRGSLVKAHLKTEFWRGVEEGEGPAPTATKVALYKSVTISRTDEGYVTGVDPESTFESEREAKRFIDAQVRGRANPMTLAWPAWVDERDENFLLAVWKAGTKTENVNVRSIRLEKLKRIMHKYFVGAIKMYDDTSLPLWLSPLMTGQGEYYTIMRTETAESNPHSQPGVRTRTVHLIRRQA